MSDAKSHVTTGIGIGLAIPRGGGSIVAICVVPVAASVLVAAFRVQLRELFLHTGQLGVFGLCRLALLEELLALVDLLRQPHQPVAEVVLVVLDDLRQYHADRFQTLPGQRQPVRVRHELGEVELGPNLRFERDEPGFDLLEKVGVAGGELDDLVVLTRHQLLLQVPETRHEYWVEPLERLEPFPAEESDPTEIERGHNGEIAVPLLGALIHLRHDQLVQRELHAVAGELAHEVEQVLEPFVLASRLAVDRRDQVVQQLARRLTLEIEVIVAERRFRSTGGDVHEQQLPVVALELLVHLRKLGQQRLLLGLVLLHVPLVPLDLLLHTVHVVALVVLQVQLGVPQPPLAVGEGRFRVDARELPLLAADRATHTPTLRFLFLRILPLNRDRWPLLDPLHLLLQVVLIALRAVRIGELPLQLHQVVGAGQVTLLVPHKLLADVHLLGERDEPVVEVLLVALLDLLHDLQQRPEPVRRLRQRVREAHVLVEVDRGPQIGHDGGDARPDLVVVGRVLSGKVRHLPEVAGEDEIFEAPQDPLVQMVVHLPVVASVFDAAHKLAHIERGHHHLGG
uniref:Uncharacterized protein n=1 Tax=Anopheles farauti TaxID=69004 RepID=A0A182QPV3_9DIPT